MRSILLCLFFLIATRSVSAQDLIQGRILDGRTGEALSFVNVGIIGKNIGTVTGDDGRFQLKIPTANLQDTLRISMVGYKPRNYIVGDYLRSFSGKDLKLEQAMYQLPDVVVNTKPLKEKILGNKTESMNTTVGFTSGDLGNEIGMLIKIKRSPTFIRKFAASVATDNNAPLRMRLNFYSVKNGLPDKLIHNKNIIVDAPRSNGKFEVDLSAYDLVAEEDFFVTLEWIERGNGRFHFSSSFLGSPLVARETSQGDWHKLGIFGVGFTVLVAY